MADRIKGITVEIGGDTTGLSKALTGVNKEIKTTQSQLKDVERLLKLDPGNTELLVQKQKLLGQAVSETKDKLSALKDAQKQVQDQFARGEVSQQQYDGLQREIIATEQELKNLETAANNSNVALQKIGTAAGKVSEASGKVASATAPATAAIAGLGAVCFNAASDMTESQNKVEVAFGDNADSVKQFASTTLKSFGIAKGSALDMAAQFGDMGTSMGLSTDSAAEMSTSLVGLAGDLASFKNIGLDQATTALNGIFTGETESMKTLGVVMTQTNLDAYALANGFGKTTSEMTEAEKVQLRYAYVMNATKNAQGDFARTSDGAANSMRIMKESASEAAAELGTVLLPIITPIIQKITEAIQAFANMDEGQKTALVTILALVAAISPIAGLISGITGAISGVATAIPIVTAGWGTLSAFVTTTAIPAMTSSVGGFFAFIMANPIVAVIAIIIAAIVGLVAVVATKGDEIQAKLTQVDEFMQGVFATDWTNVFGPVLGAPINAFMANFKAVWDSIQQVLNGVIDIIRGVFTGDWDRAWKGVIEVFRGIFSGLEAIAKAPINGIIGLLNGAVGAINTLIGGFNSMGFDMPEWLGGDTWHPSIPKIPSIPLLANGGTFNRGSAIVGDAGPELLTLAGGVAKVTPLSGNTTNHNATFGNINCTVYAADVQDVDQLADRVADRINSAMLRKAGAF